MQFLVIVGAVGVVVLIAWVGRRLLFRPLTHWDAPRPRGAASRQVFRARPWPRGNAGPIAGQPGFYHRPADIELDEDAELLPPPRPVRGVFGE